MIYIEPSYNDSISSPLVHDDKKLMMLKLCTYDWKINIGSCKLH